MNENLKKWFDAHSHEIIENSDKIWEFAEPPMEEYESCKVLSEYLRKNGFAVETFHCFDKTRPDNTIIATWGSGKPVIGIYGEYDALRGLGQDAVPYPSPRKGKAGHGCGHCLMGSADSAAAVAIKNVMEAEGLTGTIKFFGTPAEEGGNGKIFMSHDHIFDGIDCCLSWHPMDRNITPTEDVLLAINNVLVEFHGIAAHAAGYPHLGRSALDACELMNVGVNYLREHVTDDVRIHYKYLHGGDTANTVADYASLQYIVRAKNAKNAFETLERVKKVAEGAAHMTETTLEFTVLSSACETFISHPMNAFCYESAKKIPEITYTPEEEQFAAEIYKCENGKYPEESILYSGLKAPTGKDTFLSGSTDCGYITRMVPTCRFFGTGWIKDVRSHAWGTVAAVGSSIGHKAEVYASKILAQCVYDILQNPAVIEDWKADLAKKVTEDDTYYQPLVSYDKQID